MMTGWHLFYSSSSLLVLIATSIVLMAAALIGFLAGRKLSHTSIDQSQIGTIQASVLGMLALMLGFTFGVASERFDTRRMLAIDETNAIGTTFLRAQTLSEPYRTNLSIALRKYVDLRLQSVSKLHDAEALAKIRQDTQRAQQTMWKQAAAVVKEDPSDITGLFEESLNESIDLYASRVASFAQRVPDTILWILAMIAIIGIGIVGYGFGLVNQRSWLIMALLSVVVALVIVMIVDLDRPEAGPTRVSHQPMVDLKNSMAGFEQTNR